MKKIPKTLFILLFLVWMLPGLIGRDPRSITRSIRSALPESVQGRS